MNRKNTILIAVMINVGLLAVLLVAAITTQDELPVANPVIADAPLVMPKFDDTPVFNELPVIAAAEPVKLPEMQIQIVEKVEKEELLHKLPSLVPESAPVAALPQPTPTTAQVTVKKGDSLERIARANHTSVDEIIKLNQLSGSFLKVGQTLKIPTERSLPKAQDKKVADLGPEYYTMKVGDNPWAIAMKHHMKVDELLRLNGLNEERARKLKPGDRLRTR